MTSVLSADTFTNPLPLNVRAMDTGGVKHAIDAYQDGIGVEVIDNIGVATDNSAMNILTLKFGELAKSNNDKIANYVLASSIASFNDIDMANSLLVTCDDNNPNTFYDKKINGVCVGTLLSALIFESNENNLKNEATFDYRMINSFWNQTGAGLFDKLINYSTNMGQTNLGVYWAYANGEDTTLEITVKEPFRIWRSKNFLETSGYGGYAQNLRIFKKDGINWVDVSSNNLTIDYNFVKWQLFTKELMPGTYRFKGIDYKYRFDLEWFIEKKI